MVTILGSSLVSISELGIGHPRTPAAVSLLQDLICFLLGEMKNIVHDLSLLNLLEELIRNCASASKLTGLGGQLFLRLRGKCGIDNQTVDEKEYVIPDLCSLQRGTTLVLLFQNFR